MKTLGITPKLLAQEVAAGADEWVADSRKDLIFSTLGGNLLNVALGI